jgi:preprotein translocase subunit YajC
MYLLLIRPQQKKQRAQQALLNQIHENDEVMLTSGIYGFVTAMDDDTVWVEVAEGVELRVVRGAIARKVDTTGAASQPGASDDTDGGEDADAQTPATGDAES